MMCSVLCALVGRLREVAAVLLVVAWPCSARAEDTGNWQILGFSEDGSYMAWEMSGTQPGSDSPYSDIYILDVAKNRYAVPPITTVLAVQSASRAPSPTEGDARKANDRKARPLLKRFGIEERFKPERGELENRKRVPAKDPNHEHMARITAELSCRGAKWTLVLQEVADKRHSDDGIEQRRLFDLRLRGPGHEQLLQKDTRLPQSRGAAYEYDLGSAWIYRSSLVVVVSYLAPGFESRDTSVLLVTAKIP